MLPTYNTAQHTVVLFEADPYPSRTVVLRRCLRFSADLAGALPIWALRSAELAPRITMAATIDPMREMAVGSRCG